MSYLRLLFHSVNSWVMDKTNEGSPTIPGESDQMTVTETYSHRQPQKATDSHSVTGFIWFCVFCVVLADGAMPKGKPKKGYRAKGGGRPKGCSKPMYLIVIGAGKSAIRKRPAIQKQKAVISKSLGENNKDGEPLTRPSEYYAPTSKPWTEQNAILRSIVRDYCTDRLRLLYKLCRHVLIQNNTTTWWSWCCVPCYTLA